MSSTNVVTWNDLGRIEYKSCWDFQQKLFDDIIRIKLQNRSTGDNQTTQSYMLFCEHPHVYTLGKSGEYTNLLISEVNAAEKGLSFYKTNRGGDITYHGPGQIVGYPILDLDNFFTDVHRYLRYLEEAIIRMLARYGITADRYPGYTGVWLDPEKPLQARKIAAMGVRMSRWVTMHGFALNVNTDLSMFNFIVPCGIEGKQVTSMEKELGHKVDSDKVKQELLEEMAILFFINWRHDKTLKPELSVC